MTSKSLFFKQMKEDRKRRTWTIVLFVCICFIFSVAFEMMLENTVNLFQSHVIVSRREFLSQIREMTGAVSMPFYLLLSGVGAMLFGFQGFSWLTSRQKVDFYHSLPITRKEGFFIRYCNGVLLFALPLLIQMTGNGLFLAVRGLLTGENARNLLVCYGIYLLAFLLMYHLIILAIMMTGHLLVAALAAATFLLYASVVRMMMSYYYGHSFLTAYNQVDHFKWMAHGAPLEKIISMCEIVTEKNIQGGMNGLIHVVILMGITFLLALWLYQIRPSERAGKALAFPKTGSVIRILIVIPAAMILGMFFSLMTGAKSTLWLYLGSLMGGIFVHGFMEVIFHFDIKAAFRKNIQLAGTLAVLMVIVSVFHFDLLGYDTYLPEEDKLKAISYQANFTEEVSYSYRINENGEMMQMVPQQAMVRTEDVKDLYQLLKSHVATLKREKEQEEKPGKYFTVCYELKNGKKVYREYQIEKKLLEEKFASSYESKEFKETFYPAINLSGTNIDSITCSTPFEAAYTLEFGEKEIKELLTAYQKDIEADTFERYLNQKKTGQLQIIFKNTGAENPFYMEISIQNHYGNVIRYLESKGVSLTLPNEKYEIEEAKIYYSKMSMDDMNAGDVDIAMTESEEFRTLTGEEIKEILPHLIGLDYIRYDNLNEKQYGYQVNLMLRNKKTNLLKQVEYGLDQSNLPSSLRKK